ncbi:hypothetical protein F5X99DRAFT_163360 [Biscogniauxia marginata]|nr:hypothetical protein F5X99DRAFT_163360 [Biscogniauxia marginata]
MANAHGAFEALGPINWDDIAQDDIQTFLANVFTDAQCLVDSIPVSLASLEQKFGRQRSATDSDLPSLLSRTPRSTERARELRKEWKETKINPRENPLGLDVYKLAAKDGKGSWFARRSVHEGLTFETWKLGVEKEFAESMKVQGKPGDGNIRGIGAEKRVVNETVESCGGKMEVYQLSAQFPGPTTPRDFVTLLLSFDSAKTTPMSDRVRQPRCYMVVSKPCVHPECPQRQGFIRGQYESVEFIREIKVDKPLRKIRSSIDLSREDSGAAAKDAADSTSKEAMMRSARQATVSNSSINNENGRPRGRTIAFSGTDNGQVESDEDYDTMIEWVMITRSDPGGSVPRFMIERGTPAGIAGDANKFLQWISSKTLDYFNESGHVDTKLEHDASGADQVATEKKLTTADLTPNIIAAGPRAKSKPTPSEQYVEETPGPGGLYGMISGALGAAASAAASRLPNPFGSFQDEDVESDVSTDRSDETSTIHSFHSFESDGKEDSSLKQAEDTHLTPSVMNSKANSTHSSESTAARSTYATSQHEKELRKLEERKRRTEEKLQRAQEQAIAKRRNDAQRDEIAVQKMRKKHEREVTKQEEKYQRELRKLEAKRASEQKKAEERRRKQAEREEKANLAIELEKVRAERDIARKQVEVLKEQIGDLQGQNTMLVARLGREGISLGSGSSESLPSPVLRRAMTDRSGHSKTNGLRG